MNKIQKSRSVSIKKDERKLEEEKMKKDRKNALKKVFGNHLLLHKILTNAIHNRDGKLDPKLIQKVLLIQKSWLLTTTRLLRKFGKPAIKLTLDQEKSLNGRVDMLENGKLRNRLNQTFIFSEDVIESASPFVLSLSSTFFWEENYESLFDCLLRLRSNLVELRITYPKDCSTLPFNFPNLSFPSLRKLMFVFSSENKGKNDDDDNIVVPFDNNVRGMLLLQYIINSTENLESLTLFFGDTSFNEDDSLYNVLERVQSTLKCFKTGGLEIDRNRLSHTHLRFPIMEHLEEIEIFRAKCELGPGEVSNLQEFVPNLKSLTISFQTETTCKKWFKNSTFENVNELSISVVNESFQEDDENYYVSLDFELVTGMHMAFPNILELYLSLNVSDISCLNYIFQRMTRLTTLHINFHGNFNDFSSDLFDSKVLSLPIGYVANLRKHGGHIEMAELERSQETSIRNLDDLKTLGLATKRIPKKARSSLLSPILMKYGFLKMTFLHNLVLQGKFKPTQKIRKLWTDDDGSMEYYNE